jgi:hypothetical protein
MSLISAVDVIVTYPFNEVIICVWLILFIETMGHKKVILTSIKQHETSSSTYTISQYEIFFFLETEL